MVSFSEPSVNQTLNLRSIKRAESLDFSQSTYDSLDKLVFSICEIYRKDKTAGQLALENLDGLLAI